jgi:hypothetical protein
MDFKRSTSVAACAASNVFPAHIGNYTFVNTAEHPEKRSPYEFAIYQDARGVRVFAKRWRGMVKGAAYYWLHNEAVVNAVLTAMIERDREAFEPFCVTVPRYIGFVEERGSAIILSEFVAGTYLADASPVEQGTAFERILGFLNAVDGQLTPIERRLLRRRGMWHMAATLPFMAVRAALRYPDLTWMIVQSCIAAYRRFPSLIRRTARVFVHRDVHGMNVIMSDRKAVLLDFQFSVLADPLWELAVLAVHGWHHEAFHRMMSDLERTTPHFERRAYEAFAAYAGIVDLAMGRSHRRLPVSEYLGEIVGNKPRQIMA